MQFTEEKLNEMHNQKEKLFLKDADLGGANLSNSDLVLADLNKANLSRVKFTKSTRSPEVIDPKAAGAKLVE